MKFAIVNVIETALFFGCLGVTLAAKRNIAEFTKIEWFNESPDLIKETTFVIGQTAQNVSAFYVNFTLSETLHNLNGIYFISVKHGNKFVNYTAMEMNYCQALHMIHTQYMIQKVASGLRHVSNFPLDCPFLKNKRYYVNGFIIDPKIIPSYVPSITFRSETTFESNNRKLGRFISYGKVRKSL